VYFKYPYTFNSRRSLVIGKEGMVATSHPLAVQTGVDILKKGGNAVDAAISTAAVLTVVESASTGIGGDAFALVYISETGELKAINASGPALHRATVESYRRRGYTSIPEDGILSVSVPGGLKE